MKLFADNKTSFEGPLKNERAEQLVGELPPGAAVHLGNGVVKMLRTVRSKGWVLDAVEPEPKSRRNVILAIE